jgi:hypothetical protein
MQAESSLEQALQHVVGLLPLAGQYPEKTAARLMLDGCEYVTPGLQRGNFRHPAGTPVDCER